MPAHHRIISPLPFKVYYLTIFMIALGGFIAACYLAASHYRVYTDMEYRSFCALTRSINCDTVSQSPHSILWGLPVPLWGIFGYALLLLFLVLAFKTDARPTRFWPLILCITMAYSLMSFFFAYLSILHIRSYCIICITTYAVNLLILFYAWLIRRRFDIDPFYVALKKDLAFFIRVKKNAVYLFSPLLASAIMVWIFLPSYWQIPAPPLSADTPTGQTQEGHPWIGARKPVLTITEFSDYQCFQCKKMHFFLRTLVQENPDGIRLVHRHFPMDHEHNPLFKEPFHVGSGEMALLAVYAATQNMFWPVNDFLFEMGRQKRPFNTKEIGEKTGLHYMDLARSRKDPVILFRLQKDIMEGIKLGVRGTPAFVIDGQLFTGQIPPEVIKKALK